MLSQQIKDTGSLLDSVDAIRNWRAVCLLLTTFVAVAVLVAAGGWLAQTSFIFLAFFILLAYGVFFYGFNAVGLMMTLNRRIHKAYQRTRDANFSLEGLVGFNMHGRTAGIIGTGKIGIATLRILKGFGMRLLVSDPYPSQAAIDLGAEYVDIDTLLRQSDVISLHCPLFKENYHLLNKEAFAKMKDGVMIINTSRGGLLDSNAAIEALKTSRIGALGLDVYEEEEDLFFEDKSNEVITDDVFRRLSACHNVLFTGHQAFLTREALHAIADTTLGNIQAIESQGRSDNEVE